MGMINWQRGPAGTFAGWQFKPETFTLDSATASLEQLEQALEDCDGCIAAEYPETQAGTYAALDRSAELREALTARFGDHGRAAIDRCFERGMYVAKAAHPR